MAELTQHAYQELLPGIGGLEAAVNAMRDAGIEERGAVFTKREVVDFILDLSGYDPRENLFEHRLLEPSFGAGNFLLPAIQRLIKSFIRHGGTMNSADSLRNCIRAVELHSASFHETAARIRHLLLAHGCSASSADVLVNAWLMNEDFLLAELPGEFNHVVGNPPYVRQERIPDVLLAEYRSRFSTIFDRADLYVPFIERSLRLLGSGGSCVFICSDRWMKNRYGAPLRKLVSRGFRLKAFIDMVDTPAFESDVIAYPAIAVISREAPGPVQVASRPEVDRRELERLAAELRNGVPGNDKIVAMTDVVQGEAPWLFDGLEKLALVRRLESEFPTLEEAGCRVGIGVATGADKIFIRPDSELDIEPDRKLPLVTTRDIISGEVQWKGLSLANPFDDQGRLVNLADFPKLAAYFKSHRKVITNRHVAKKNISGWYRTIDKVHSKLASQPKLLIPDIKGAAAVVYEEGKFYPHHNLYYIISSIWDLRALQLVLASGLAHLFISVYSTRMRGGYLRFQAQYLRRIRIPRWEAVSPELKRQFKQASPGDLGTAARLVADLYDLTPKEVAVLQELQSDVAESVQLPKKSP